MDFLWIFVENTLKIHGFSMDFQCSDGFLVENMWISRLMARNTG